MQQVIVYRNPLEAAVWDSLMNGGWVVFAGVIALGFLWVGAYVATDWMQRRVFKRSGYAGCKHYARTSTSVAWVVTIIATALIFWRLM